MSGIVPSSATAGSSAAGTPGTPTRTSRRTLDGTDALGGWEGADEGHARTSVRRMTARRIRGMRINVLYTWNPRPLPAVPRAEEWGERYETCCPRLTETEGTRGTGPAQPVREKMLQIQGFN